MAIKFFLFALLFGALTSQAEISVVYPGGNLTRPLVLSDGSVVVGVHTAANSFTSTPELQAFYPDGSPKWTVSLPVPGGKLTELTLSARGVIVVGVYLDTLALSFPQIYRITSTGTLLVN